MKKYFGKKVINAMPMSRQEYNDFRGWELPADEDGSDDGFIVEYIDGGKANTSQYAGYISWSPAGVFERAYRVAETPLDRMYIEYDELKDRHNSLVQFLGREDAIKIAGENQVTLMRDQETQMRGYLQILKNRIDLMIG